MPVAASTPADTLLPTCSQAKRGQRFISWGKYGLHFLITKREVDVLGGKVDVDYVKYVIKPKNRGAALALWFGGMALSQKPDQQLLSASSNVTQAKIVDPSKEVIGLDSRGLLKDGSNWRQFVVHSEGAIYVKVSPEDSVLFDQIISSACWIPYPNK